jgi:AraC-like DNA-binding protein
LLTKFYIPHPLLQEFINCIMIVHVQVDTTSGPVICPYPPAPQDSLFFYLDDLISVKKQSAQEFIAQPRSVLVGTQLEGVSVNIHRSHKAVRVGFQPGGMYRLLGINMHEFIDNSYNAEDVFGNEMHALNERLCDCVTFDEIKTIIESFLMKKVNHLQRSLPFDRVMQELVRRGGTFTMDEAADLACLSVRQFERVSKQRIGMPPKLYARLVRFSKAYRIRENFAHLSWTHIAHQCGYFDQMHFIRDFKLFAGVTPTIIDKELKTNPVRLQAQLRL